ncbi:hypothetical protein GCM10010441_07940 [Kitasatospora paracochleata]
MRLAKTTSAFLMIATYGECEASLPQTHSEVVTSHHLGVARDLLNARNFRICDPRYLLRRINAYWRGFADAYRHLYRHASIRLRIPTCIPTEIHT